MDTRLLASTNSEEEKPTRKTGGNTDADRSADKQVNSKISHHKDDSQQTTDEIGPRIDNLPYKSKRKRTEKKTIELACVHLREGATIKAVAKEFNVSESRVNQWLHKYFPTTKKQVGQTRRKISDKEKLECCSLFEQGATTKFL